MHRPTLLTLFCASTLLTACSRPLSEAAETWIVKDHQPEAEIVIAVDPPRSVKVAAEELRANIEKMTGASLPIVNTPSAPDKTRIYVGQSSLTDELGITGQTIPDGGYEMKSGSNWLALVGKDDNFVPKEPWARNLMATRDPNSAYVQEWDKLTGSHWANPVGDSLIKDYSKALDLWEMDQRGPLNAVYAYLRSLGFEWYMPGPLGEIVPKAASIPLPDGLAKVVKPDFGLRYHHTTNFNGGQMDDILWYLRLGLSHGSDKVGMALSGLSHGMGDVTQRPEMHTKHPDFYAIRGGKPAFDKNHLNLTSEQLFEENLQYARFMFDHYEMPMVSLMPEDGLVGSEDPASRALETRERGALGSHSDYVWGYVNRLAQDLSKTHPDKLVSNFSYANYVLPPEKIDKLSPNIVVGLLQYRFRPEDREKHLESRKAWQAKLGGDNKMIIWTHYPFNAPGRPFYGIPAYFPRLIAEDLASLRGVTSGELVEVMFDPKTFSGLYAPGFNHLNSFVTARYYWDSSQDINAFLDKYYKDFYGPAAPGMKAFIEYCEANWQKMKKDATKIREAEKLLAEAQNQAPAGSPYAQRIALVADYMKPLGGIAARIEAGRQPTKSARLTPDNGVKVLIDGKLDEPEWKSLPGNFNLVNLVEGTNPENPTQVSAFFTNRDFYLGIRCFDRGAANIDSRGIESDSPEIWAGDNLEILIETVAHSWYQITINPDGVLVDADRASGVNTEWDSAAEVVTKKDNLGWTAEVRIPIAPPEHTDPLQIIRGEVPTPDMPWFINIGRKRTRDGVSEFTAWSPTGKASFGELDKFGEIYTGVRREPTPSPSPAAATR